MQSIENNLYLTVAYSFRQITEWLRVPGLFISRTVNNICLTITSNIIHLLLCNAKCILCMYVYLYVCILWMSVCMYICILCICMYVYYACMYVYSLIIYGSWLLSLGWILVCMYVSLREFCTGFCVSTFDLGFALFLGQCKWRRAVRIPQFNRLPVYLDNSKPDTSNRTDDGHSPHSASTIMHTYIEYIHRSKHIYIHSLNARRHTYIPLMQENIHTYIPFIQEKIHTYIPFIQAKIHTYIHTLHAKKHTYIPLTTAWLYTYISLKFRWNIPFTFYLQTYTRRCTYIHTYILSYISTLGDIHTYTLIFIYDTHRYIHTASVEQHQ